MGSLQIASFVRGEATTKTFHYILLLHRFLYLLPIPSNFTSQSHVSGTWKEMPDAVRKFPGTIVIFRDLS